MQTVVRGVVLLILSLWNLSVVVCNLEEVGDSNVEIPPFDRHERNVFLSQQPNSKGRRWESENRVTFPSFMKRPEKGILLDVGDFVINAGENAIEAPSAFGGGGGGGREDSLRSYLVRSPASLRLGGMMRTSG